MAPSNTAAVLRRSIGTGSTAKTFEPLSATDVDFSTSAPVNTTVTRFGTWVWMRSRSPRRSLVSAGIDDEQLQAPRADDLLERRRGGIDRADGVLATAAYGFTQLQQEVVPRGDGDDFGRSLRGD